MGDAKALEVKPITSQAARRVVEQQHYSGKVVPNSQLHLGVFFRGVLEGVMQFGPPLDKRKMQGLVRDAPWESFCELNRMAFSPALPRNSESRALSVAFRMLLEKTPIRWVVSFADGTQCGDGAIYRASGFLLIGVKKNTSLLRMPDGGVKAKATLDHDAGEGGRFLSSVAMEQGATPLPGFQIKYVKFLDPTWVSRLTVPVLPFSTIAQKGAQMYLGRTRAGSKDAVAPVSPGGRGPFNSDPGAPLKPA